MSDWYNKLKMATPAAPVQSGSDWYGRLSPVGKPVQVPSDAQIPAAPQNDVPGKLMYPVNAAAGAIVGLPNMLGQSMTEEPAPSSDAAKLAAILPGYREANRRQGEAIQRHTYSPEEVSKAIAKVTDIEPVRAESAGGRIAQDIGTGALVAAPATLLGSPEAALPTIAGGGLSGGAQGTAREAGAPDWVQNVAGILAPLAMGGTALSIARTAQPTAEKIIGRALKNVPPEAMQKASTIFYNAKKMGTPVTWLEALNKASGGSLKQAAAAQRVAESTPGGQQILGPMMARRASANSQALPSILDQIGPKLSDTETGLVAQKLKEAGQGALSGAETDLRGMTKPFYQASSGVNVPASKMRAVIHDLDGMIAKTGSAQVKAQLQSFREELTGRIAQPSKEFTRIEKYAPESDVGALMNYARTGNFDPHLAKMQTVIGQTQGTAELPITDIGRLDSIRKVWRDKIELPNPNINSGALSKEAASKIGGTLSRIRNLMQEASVAYSAGRRVHGAGMQNVIEPMEQSPVGQLAEAPPQMGAQRGVIAPIGKQETLRPGAIVQTAAELAKRSPTALRNWVRTNLESIFDDANRNLQGGQNEWGGARFAKTVAGSDIQKQNLNALIEVAGGHEAAAGFNRMLEVLEAQGMRQPAGSLTAFNTEAVKELQGGKLPSLQDLTPFGQKGFFTEKMQQWRYGVNSKRLAELITQPENLDKLRKLSKMSPYSPGARSFMNGILSNSLASQPSQQRGGVK